MPFADFDKSNRVAQSVHGGVVLVSLYSWSCVVVGVTVTRILLSLLRKVSIGMDDAMALVGTIVYIAASVAWHYAVDAGLGQHMSELSQDSSAQYFKSTYAAQLLQVIAIGFGKLSSAFLVVRVVAQTPKQNAILFGSVAIWVVYALLAMALQCAMPTPWVFSPQKCGYGGMSFSVIVLNMASDILLAVWIFPVLHGLNMASATRRGVGFLFACRALVAVFSIAELWAAARAGRSNDQTYDSWKYAVLQQAVASLSLLVASLPRINRFLLNMSTSLEGGAITDGELAFTKATTMDATGDGPIQLTPLEAGKTRSTITSGKSRSKDKSKMRTDWQKFVNMGSKADDDTSTSSLFDRQEGVLRRHDIVVHVEKSNSADDIEASGTSVMSASRSS